MLILYYVHNKVKATKFNVSINEHMKRVELLSLYTAEVDEVRGRYSETSEERTLWERHFCPLFGGCPLLGGCLIFALYPPLE